jgi:hypothetical protein
VPRWFVPWVADAETLVDAMRSLDPDIVRNVTPLVPGGITPELAAKLSHVCAAVYVDSPSPARAPLPDGAVALYDMDAPPPPGHGRGDDAIAVRVHLDQFGEPDRLAAGLDRFCRIRGAAPAATTLVVDVSPGVEPARVVVTAAAGAVRRARSLQPWRHVVVTLRGPQLGPRGTLPRRVPLRALAADTDLAGVSIGEQPPAAGSAAEAYRAGDDWILAIVAPTRCPDRRTLRWALLVHWIESSVAAL